MTNLRLYLMKRSFPTLLSFFVLLECTAFGFAQGRSVDRTQRQNDEMSSNIPPDWRQRIEQGQMLFSSTDPSEWFMWPNIANGYLGTIIHNDTIYVSGVYNGEGINGPQGPSHRAVIPSTCAVTTPELKQYASALDIQRAHYLRRSFAGDGALQQKWFAHRAFPELLVYEMEYFGNATTSVQLGLITRNSPDIAFQKEWLSNETVVVMSGTINHPEIRNGERVQVVVVSDAVPPRAQFSQGNPRLQLLTVIRTSLDSADPKKTALTLFQKHKATPPKDLEQSHLEAWEELWTAGIEVGSNLKIAASVNSTLYYILSSVRDDWKYGISPGGIPTNAYNGHIFWDQETWMLPTLILLSPSIARSLLDYRFARIPAAREKALSYPYSGIMYPWESGFTGTEVCPWALGAEYEQHISGDISFAVMEYFRCTGDLGWLSKFGSQIVRDVATFWASRVSFNSQLGQYQILGVVPPDEHAGVVNNSVYTNTISKVSLENGIWISKKMGLPYPPLWEEIVNNTLILFNATQQYHPEYQGYAGQLINQPDVVLLQYPLQQAMSSNVAENDVDYYVAHTNPLSFFTGYSTYSILYLQQAKISKANRILNRTFEFMLAPFNTWREKLVGGHHNFLTGAGGYLQNMVFGYGGVRIQSDRLDFSPILPPDSDLLKFRHLNYQGYVLDVFFNTTQVTINLQSIPSKIEASGLCVVYAQEIKFRLVLHREIHFGIGSFHLQLC